MREIGSEFWTAELCGQPNALFLEDTKWFLSGRSALGYILDDIQSRGKVTRAMLPSWCCESMILPFLERHMEVSFYPVYVEHGKLVCEFPQSGELMLTLDYFGYQREETRSNFSGIVIRDVTHSIFSGSRQDADYMFGSLRKWIGISTGGFAMGRMPWNIKRNILLEDERYITLRNLAMKKKGRYIAGESNDKGYLSIFAEAEKMLDSCGIQAAPVEDIARANVLDVHFIVSRRRENAGALMRRLNSLLLFSDLNETDCPLFVPIILGERDGLKKYLIENQIFCPVHWPVSKYHKLNDRTMELYQKELSLVCDQRYGPEEMERISRAVIEGVSRC